MSKPNYRVLFNADCSWPILQAPDPVTPQGGARVADAVVRGGAYPFPGMGRPPEWRVRVGLRVEADSATDNGRARTADGGEPWWRR